MYVCRNVSRYVYGKWRDHGLEIEPHSTPPSRWSSSNCQRSEEEEKTPFERERKLRCSSPVIKV